MRFLDANVLIYACYMPKSISSAVSASLKEKSQLVLRGVDKGEEVVISVVHLSEVANVLQKCSSAEHIVSLLESLYAKENIHIVDVTQQDYFTAIEISHEFGVKVNDCLAAFLMKKLGISEIYTFDQEFRKFPGIKALPK